jgi:hypothetical protein
LSHSGNSTTYSQSGKYQILQRSCNGGNKLFDRIMGLYAVVTLVLAIRFSVISSPFRLKWRSNTPIDYKNAKLILVPEKRCRTLSWIRFSSTKRNTTTVKLKPNCTHNSRMWLKTHVGYFIRTIENRFWFNLFYFFYKKKPYNSTTFLPMRK